MKAALVLLALLLAVPAQADEAAKLGNTLAVEQLVDMLETRNLIRDGAHENDPLARPFVHSGTSLILAAGATNVLARHLVGPRAKPWLLRAAVGLYPLILRENAKHLKGASFSFKL